MKPALQIQASRETKTLDLERLREESKSWSPEQWEEHLQSLETPLIESQISPKKFNRIAERGGVTVFDYAQTSASEPLIQKVRDALEHLTKSQRAVVEFIYFKSRSSREAALALGISRSTVRSLLRKAHKNLRSSLIRGTPTFPIVEGEFLKTSPKGN